MNDSDQNPSKKYEVTVGHARVTFECGDQRQVIPEARRLLSLEMPRLWDMIQTMAESRFQVAVVE